MAITSSILSSFLVIVNPHEILLSSIFKKNKRTLISIKSTIYIKFYSDFISQTLLLFSFLIFSSISLFLMKIDIPNTINPILYNVLIILDGNIVFSLIFLLLAFLISIKLIYSYYTFNERIQRTDMYYLMMEDSNLNGSKSMILNYLKEYEGYVNKLDWENEKNSYLKLKREVNNIFSQKLSSALIPALGSYKNLKGNSLVNKLQSQFYTSQFFLALYRELKYTGYYHVGFEKENIKENIKDLSIFEKEFEKKKNYYENELKRKYQTDKLSSDFVGELAEKIFNDKLILEKIREHVKNMENFRKLIVDLDKENLTVQEKLVENQRVQFLEEDQRNELEKLELT